MVNEFKPPDNLANLVGIAPNFEKAGNEFFSYFLDLGQLKPNHSFLDVGCGVGRMAIPLISYLKSGNFEGFDILPDAIEWCKNNIEPKYPNFHFILVDIYNKHFNPNGKLKASEFKFPYHSDTFDFVSLSSVLTHLLPMDMENYLSETVRVLKRNGRCLITYFLINDESITNIENHTAMYDFKDSMKGYRTIDKNDPERAIGYNEVLVKQLYKKHNLQIIGPIHYGQWARRKKFLSGQDIIIAVKK